MIRDLTDQNKSALDQLSFLAHRFLDTSPAITRLLDVSTQNNTIKNISTVENVCRTKPNAII